MNSQSNIQSFGIIISHNDSTGNTRHSPSHTKEFIEKTNYALNPRLNPKPSYRSLTLVSLYLYVAGKVAGLPNPRFINYNPWGALDGALLNQQ